MQRLIEGIELKQLKKNVDERGYLCEILRKDWDIFKEFAMAYFSITFPGVARAHLARTAAPCSKKAALRRGFG